MLTAPPAISVAVMTSDRDLGSANRLPVQRNRWTSREGVPVYFVSTDMWRELCRSCRTARAWRPDVIYLNSFFSPGSSAAVQLLSRLGWWRGATVVIGPSGQMNPGALAIKSTKKKLYMSLYRRSGMLKRVLWHASSDTEQQNIRRVLDTRNVLVRENETLLPKRAARPAVAADGPLRAVFLARICRIKGLSVALQALCGVGKAVTLDIFGPPEDTAYLQECKVIAALVPENVTVKFLGIVQNSEVLALLARYELMVLPTDGENFGHVIAEALSVSCPVMCTPFTPWTERLRAGGGVVVPGRHVRDWSEALDGYASLPGIVRDQQRIAAGAAYSRWREEAWQPHIFELVREHRVRSPSRRARKRVS